MGRVRGEIKKRDAQPRKPVKPPARSFQIDPEMLAEVRPCDLPTDELASFLSNHVVAPLRKCDVALSGRGNELFFADEIAQTFEWQLERNALFNTKEVVEALAAIRRTMPPGSRYSSYGFKHLVEASTPSHYVGNGEGIAAVLLLGGTVDFGAEPKRSPNAVVYIPERLPCEGGA